MNKAVANQSNNRIKQRSRIQVNWRELLTRGLEEDQWRMDWSAMAVLGEKSNRKAKAKILAKSQGVWAGDQCTQTLESLSKEWGVPIKIHSRHKDGDRIRPGSTLAEWSGSARGILAFERTFLNLVSYSSGVASITDRFYQALRKKKQNQNMDVRVVPTRKILPGLRDLALYGVMVGGGSPHRPNLSGGVLIKENHIRLAGSIQSAVRNARDYSPHGMKIEIEIQNEKELKEALESRADVIMLDNFSPDDVRKSMRLIDKARYQPTIEVSGNLNEANIDQYLISGVSVLSVGSLTHSVRITDLSLLMQS